MTHALEVTQVARSVAEALRLNVPLAEAIAIGHDCGHGPGGHASEDALSPYLDGGFDHAPWGADVTLQPLNLCAETLDGIRHHSWSLPAPQTPEGEVVSWADRIAYVCHDFEDAVAAGILQRRHAPCGRRRTLRARPVEPARHVHPGDDHAPRSDRAHRDGPRHRRGAGRVPQVQLRARLPAAGEPPPGRRGDRAAARPRRALRRPAARRSRWPTAQAAVDIDVEHLEAGSADALRAAVAYVAGMTDRFACQQGLTQLNWDPAKLPTASASEPAIVAACRNPGGDARYGWRR